MADLELLQAWLKHSVLPESWSDSGGPAEMEWFPTNLSLVITHSQAGHQAIAKQLKAMRKMLLEYRRTHEKGPKHWETGHAT